MAGILSYSAYVILGFTAGICSGLFGIGGGIIIVPALVFIMKYKQVHATATSLVALLLPVGILGVRQFYLSGSVTKVEIVSGLLIAVGMFFGAYFGANISLGLPDQVLRRAFSVFLVLVSARLWFY